MCESQTIRWNSFRRRCLNNTKRNHVLTHFIKYEKKKPHEHMHRSIQVQRELQAYYCQRSLNWIWFNSIKMTDISHSAIRYFLLEDDNHVQWVCVCISRAIRMHCNRLGMFQFFFWNALIAKLTVFKGNTQSLDNRKTCQMQEKMEEDGFSLSTKIHCSYWRYSHSNHSISLFRTIFVSFLHISL